MNWNAARAATLNEQVRSRGAKAVAVEIMADDAFWRVWKDDPVAMREAGYSVKKIDGIWRAFLTK